METKLLWFVNAFLEIDSTTYSNTGVPMLKKAGNLFTTKEEAQEALTKIKQALLK